MHRFVIMSLSLSYVLAAPQFSPDEVMKNFQVPNNPGTQILDGIRNELDQATGAIFRLQNSFRLGNVFHPIVSNVDSLADEAFKNTFGVFSKSMENVNRFSNLGGFGEPATGATGMTKLQLTTVEATEKKAEAVKPEDVKQ